jgi:hypothetical protein
MRLQSAQPHDPVRRTDRGGPPASSARAAAPSNTSPPTITGTLEQGRTLNAQSAIGRTARRPPSTAGSGARPTGPGAGTSPPVTPAVNHRPRISIHPCAVHRREGLRPVPGVRRLAPEPEHPRARLEARRRVALAPVQGARAAAELHGDESRTWLPAPRFRHGRYVVTLWARTSRACGARRPHAFFR